MRQKRFTWSTMNCKFALLPNNVAERVPRRLLMVHLNRRNDAVSVMKRLYHR